MLALAGVFFSTSIFAQKVTTKPPRAAPSPNDTAKIVIEGYKKDSLIRFAMADPTKVPKPYYRYLYIFSDGNFINGVRDSVVRHQFIYSMGKPVTPVNTNAYDVTVYASDTYSGGDPPPDKSSLDTIIINKGKGQKDTIIIGDAAKTSRSTVKLDTHLYRIGGIAKTKPVVQTNRYLHLQKNHEFRPKDTSVVIVSLKHKAGASPSGAPIAGQVYLFYNGKIKGTKTGMKSGVVDRYAEFHHDTTLIYPKFTWKVVLDTVAPGVPEFERVLVLNYLNLIPGEERHFFFEFANGLDLLDYIDLSGRDTAKVNFLAVVTVVNENGQSSVPSPLTTDQSKRLSELGILAYLPTLDSTLLPGVYAAMLQTQAFSSDVLPFNGDLSGNYPTTILDMFEMSGNIVAAKDPNHLSAYACKCGGSKQKILYSVKFTNDGSAPTSHIFVNIKIPAELDINSIADTAYIPLPSGSGHVLLEKIAPDEIRFRMNNYRLFPTSEFGVGDPMTEGSITFSILANSGVSVEDVPPLEACVRFDSEVVEPLCTNLAGVFILETESPYPGVQAVLQCKTCPWYCKICALLNIQSTWLCVLVLVVAGLLVLGLIWLIRKLF